jgi:hypothetical protein
VWQDRGRRRTFPITDAIRVRDVRREFIRCGAPEFALKHHTHQVAIESMPRSCCRADFSFCRRPSMKVHLQVIPLLIATFSIVASGQCAKPGMSPIWDSAKAQFRCTNPSSTARTSQDDAVAPIGNKDFCTKARENLQKTCPTPDAGKSCRNTAKSIFEACYKGLKASSDRGVTTDPAPQPRKTDPSACMSTFRDQQQVCQSRKTPPPAPGQPYVPDTCLSDAMAAQNKCLANPR